MFKKANKIVLRRQKRLFLRYVKAILSQSSHEAAPNPRKISKKSKITTFLDIHQTERPQKPSLVKKRRGISYYSHFKYYIFHIVCIVMHSISLGGVDIKGHSRPIPTQECTRHANLCMT